MRGSGVSARGHSTLRELTIARWVAFVSIGLFVAVLANGATSYLKRLGLLDRQNFELYVVTYCGGTTAGRPSYTFPCQCMQDPPVSEESAPVSEVKAPLLSRRYVYETAGHERVFKVFKDVLFAGLVALSLFLLATRKIRPPSLAGASPMLWLAASVVAGFLISVALWGWLFALLGLRSFAFLGVAFLGGWAAGGMQGFAWCAAAMVAIQAVLVGLEFVFGIPLRFCPFSFRGAGTLVLSNSLGVFAVVAIAFFRAFSPNRSHFWMLLPIAVILVFASGSGTAVFTLSALLGFLLLDKTSGVQRFVAVAALLAVAVALTVKLPELTQRPDIYNSLLAPEGRLDSLSRLMREANTAQLLVGHGIGFGTNSATNVLSGAPVALPDNSTGEKFSADSTVTVLFTQLGIVGIVLFYGVLGWGFWRDPVVRPVYLVIAVSSLTIIVTELFPVNFLLGLALAHTLQNGRQFRRAPAT